MNSERAFAAALRRWRERRSWSQLELSQRADISQRHLSFLELGRAAPSRDMVLRFADALDVPHRHRNALLLAAGFAPVWREAAFDSPELTGVRAALDYMLAQQQPYPAVAVDRHWNLLKANGGTVRLVEFLVGPVAPGAKINLADALVGPDVLRPHLVNWTEVVRYFIRSVEADASADGRPETVALFERLIASPDVRCLLKPSSGDVAAGPILPMHFRKEGTSLRLITIIATLGTPQDITLQELRVESFFPADEPTARILQNWSRAATV